MADARHKRENATEGERSRALATVLPARRRNIFRHQRDGGACPWPIYLPRRWQPGDVVELDLAMPIRRVHAHVNIEADRGKVALMRGPILYCLESVDNPGTDVVSAVLPPDQELAAEHRPALLGGVTVLTGRGQADGRTPIPLTAIPYYAWANRDAGSMTVWIVEKIDG